MDKSWVLYALRATFEESEIRNEILKSVAVGANLGPTLIGSEELQSYLSSLDLRHAHVFTMTNDPDLETAETHFIGAVLAHPILYLFDPAKGSEIYEAYIVSDIINYFDGQIAVEWITPSNGACQRSSRDVFCQTWSLLMLRDFLTGNSLDFGKNRYSYLLKFIQDHFPILEHRLRENYRYEILHNPALVDGFKNPRKIRKHHLAIDPVEVVSKMTVRDLL